MKKYTVTLKCRFDETVEMRFKNAGVHCRYATELNPYLVFVEAKDIQVLTDLDFVFKARESATFNLSV